MKTENSFYIFKEDTTYLLPNMRYDLQTGELIQSPNCNVIAKHNCREFKKVKFYIPVILYQYGIRAQTWDKDDNYLGYVIVRNHPYYEFEYDIPDNAYQIAFSILGTSIDYTVNIKEYFGYQINPYYKELKKKYKKESNQVFFRESLEGKINLFGKDYYLLKNASIENKFYFYLYKNDNLLINATFNKSDCIFNDVRKKVELKLSYNDRYSKILDNYDNTYDLIKIAPTITPILLTKRCVVQIYIQGANVISSYASGTYWETEVSERVYDQNLLRNKYFFSEGLRYAELNLNGSPYIISNNNIWNATYNNGSVVFVKVFSAGDRVSGQYESIIHLLSNDTQGGTYSQDQGSTVNCIYDTYRIQIWSGVNQTGTKLYESENLYAKNVEFNKAIAIGSGLYKMINVSTGSYFFLSDNVTENQIWGRIICDVDSVPDGQGGYVQTYDIPYDDFAVQRQNYKKCIGLSGFNSPNSEVQIFQNSSYSEEPTSYGINDYGKYFVPPYTLYGQYFYPLSRSSWANTSMWVKLGSLDSIDSFENKCRNYYKEYWLKDTYFIGSVIKALLSKIDKTIKHEGTAEYSSFLYGHSGATAAALGGCNIFITQKTNILKGDYDQAAKKAEITFKQLMEMLRDCFRCYWFIDEQNRFRIEHISYFMNGLSYNNPVIQLDLTLKNDKFNKKEALYDQQEIKYEKSDLTSRYEFKYMDDSTKVMGGDLYIDVKNEYIQKDKKEEINVNNFSADIDYMLFKPDDFSSDGFAIILADALNLRTPIIHSLISDEKQSNHQIDAYVQNWYASFNQLAWHYMEDLSGNNIENNNTGLSVGKIKRFLKHNIEFISKNLNIDMYKLIKTNVGNGYIEELDINIDTDLTEIDLSYEPG